LSEKGNGSVLRDCAQTDSLKIASGFAAQTSKPLRGRPPRRNPQNGPKNMADMVTDDLGVAVVRVPDVRAISCLIYFCSFPRPYISKEPVRRL
jgi:hypothetical protein